MAPSVHSFDRLVPDEIWATLARDHRVIFPIGALVNHGPHLPAGVNNLIAERVGMAVSRETGVLLAPTFPYGVVPAVQGQRNAGLRRKTR